MLIEGRLVIDIGVLLLEDSLDSLEDELVEGEAFGVEVPEGEVIDGEVPEGDVLEPATGDVEDVEVKHTGTLAVVISHWSDIKVITCDTWLISVVLKVVVSVMMDSTLVLL